MRHKVKSVVKGLVAVGIVVVLVFAGLVLRILYAPMDLPYANQMIAEEVARLAPDVQFSYEHAEIGWDWENVRPWAKLYNIQVIDLRGRMKADMPFVDIALSREAIFSGKFGVRAVTLTKPKVSIMNYEGYANEGKVEGNIFQPTKSGALRPTAAFLKPFVAAASRFGRRLLKPGEELDEINIEGGVVVFGGNEDAQAISLSLSRAVLIRREADLHFEASVHTLIESTSLSATVSGQVNPVSEKAEINASLSGLNLKELADTFNLPTGVGDLDATLSLSGQFLGDSQTGLTGAAFSVDVSEGILYHPKRFPSKPSITFAMAEIAYDPSAHMFQIEKAEIGLLNGSIILSGEVILAPDSQYPTLDLMAKLDQAELVDIINYWPKLLNKYGKPATGRLWVVNNINSLKGKNAVFKVRTDTNGKGKFDQGSPYLLQFDFENLDTQFLPGMPPVILAQGYASLTRDMMDIRVTSAVVEGIAVDQSRVVLSHLRDRSKAHADISLNLSGDLLAALKLVDNPPLKLMQKSKVEPNRFAGFIKAKTSISMPLRKGVKRDEMQILVEGEVMNLSFTGVFNDIDITKGQVTARITDDDMTVEGPVLIGGFPLDIRWSEDFVAGRRGAETSSTYVVSGAVSPDLLAAFNIDISDYYAGAGNAEVTFLAKKQKFIEGHFTADVSDATLMVPQLNWDKKPGLPGMVTGSIYFRDDGAMDIEPLILTGEKIDAVADFHWSDLKSKNRNFSAKFAARQLGENQLEATIEQAGNGVLNVNVTAQAIDIRPIIAGGLVADGAIKTDSKPNELHLKVAASKVLFLNGEYISDFLMDMQSENNEMSEVLLIGKSKGGSPIELRIGDDINHPRKALKVSGENAGGLFRGLGIFSHLIDGKFDFNGRIAGWGSNLAIDGVIQINDFLARSSTRLENIEDGGAISGIDSYLGDKDMKFDTLQMPFSFKSGFVDINAMRANGSSVGITLEGQLDTVQKVINVNGVLVPAYGLNSLLGNIPILGTILTGGEGKGLFAFSYRIKGEMENPEFNVNALSGLAPGIFRMLFEGKKGSVEKLQKQAEEKAEAEKAEKEKELETLKPDEGTDTPPKPEGSGEF